MQFATEATLEQWYAHDDRQPSINVTSTTDDSSRSFLDEFFSVQQHNAASLDSQRDKGKARGRGSSPTAVPVPTADADGAIVYDGDDSSCSVCQEACSSNQWRTHLACHHVFHVGCFNGIVQTGESQSADRCPNCRGPATMIARFRYIAFVSAHVPTVHPLATPHQSRAPSADSFQSVATAFPWQPATGEQPEGYFHATTQLPGARLGILVDPGAWTNIGGKSHVRRLAQEASNAGHEVHQRKMAKPLAVQGVGNGVQTCRWEVELPIAVPDNNGAGATLHRFETPVAEGTGEDLPRILGLRSMRAKNGVLEMEPGKERLTFPGPGGYKIEWSPGTQHFPLEPAPSGHLIMPCGDFSKLQRSTGLPQASTMFHATHDASSSQNAGSKSRRATLEVSEVGATGVRTTPFSPPHNVCTSSDPPLDEHGRHSE